MKLNIYGNQPVILPRDPQTLMEAATKNYVDTTLSNHASDDSLHLTADQNTFLDTLTVSSTEVNNLAGISSNVQSQLDSKLDLAGGTMTGFIVLHADPTNAQHAATKNYVDVQDALKVNKSGDTMTGPLVLSGDPTAALEATPKQYVDNGLNTHIADDSLHLTPAQNTFLDAITVSSAEVNYLSGVSGNIQSQLDSKFDKTGGTVSGDITLGNGFGVFVSKVPTGGTELVNKTYVDSLVHGQDWRDPVSDINLVDDSLNTPPANPVEGDVYIVASSGTGDWTGKDGYMTYWNGTQWVFLQGRAVAVGDRLGVAITSSTTPAGGLTGLAGQVVTITDATVGAIQYNAELANAGTTVLVFDPDSSHFGVTYTYTDEGNWVPTNTSVNITAGAGLELNGSTLNFKPGSALAVNGGTNVVDVQVDGNSSLAVDSNNKLTVTLDGNTITTSAAGIRLSDTAIADINDKVSKTGASTVTGVITIDSTGGLKTNTTPSVATDVPNKGYVDSADANLQSQVDSLNTTVNDLNSDPVTKTYVDNQDATKVSKSGDTMTGALVLPADPTAALEAAPKQYVDNTVGAHANDNSLHLTADQNTLLDALTVSAAEINRLAGVTADVQTQLDSKLNLSGGVMTGALTLSGTPTAGAHATTKDYVDAQDALKVNKDGDTMTGLLVLSGDPTADLGAATKQYVDNSISSSDSSTASQLATKVDKAGDTMTGLLILSGDPTAALGAATKQYVDTAITNLTNYVDTQDANLQGQIDSLNTTVDALNADPVTKTYVDNQDATKLSLAGGTMTGFLTLNADPTQNLQAATKQYVDSVAQGLRTRPSVRLATTGNIDGTYANGTAGVGSTITGSANGALTVDGMSVSAGDRVLVKDQTNLNENGDYVVQQPGDASSPFILKRVSTEDESSEIPGSYFYVYDGATLKGTGWTFTVDTPTTFTIGTDPIYVNQFSGQGAVIAGAGLTLNGNTIDINTASASRIVVNNDNIDLATTGVTAGTYTKLTVDTYGRVTNGENPNTLAGYGITDAQPLNALLTSLSGTANNGILVKFGSNQTDAKSISASGTGISITNGDGSSAGDIIVNSNATELATAGTLVARDANGDFSANVITAGLNGNASTATALQTTRNFTISGDMTAGPVSFDGTANVDLATTLNDTGVAAGDYTKVTVDSKGRVTAGSNPSTVAESGLTDAVTTAQLQAEVDNLKDMINELHNYILSRI